MRPWEKRRSDDGLLLFDDTQSLGIGDLYRYKITVDKSKLEEEGISTDVLFVRVKNKESALLRPVYLTGPYACYVDVRPHNYDENKKFEGDEKIQFTSDLRPDEHFKAKLYLNENSRREDELYSWTVDVLSQVSVTSLPKVEYRIRIGTTKAASKHVPDVSPVKGFEIDVKDTDTLWNLPPKFPTKPVHLVIVTHGIFSNIGCDMLYIKDKIEEKTFPMDESINPNIVVRGCMDNMGKSARGVRYLGSRVGKFVISTVDLLNQIYKVDKISFIGHSLGGPTQAMALHYIAVKRPDIFDAQTGVKPINFIALASPFLGVVGDFPRYVSLALDVGALGVTGRDLTLRHTPVFFRNRLGGSRGPSRLHKLILEALPQSPALAVLERLVHRTLYANVLHDGIVPLRTAALLYLDWKSLAKVHEIRKQKAKALNDGDAALKKIPKPPASYTSSSSDQSSDTNTTKLNHNFPNGFSSAQDLAESGRASTPNDDTEITIGSSFSADDEKVDSRVENGNGIAQANSVEHDNGSKEKVDRHGNVQADGVEHGIENGKNNSEEKVDRHGNVQADGVENGKNGSNEEVDKHGSDNKASIGEIPVESMDKKAALQWLMPQGLSKGNRHAKYFRTQTMEMGTGSAEVHGRHKEEKQFVPPPNASTVMAAISVITAPIPTQEYIKDPSIRTDAIVHDKIYHPSELPPPHYTNRPFIKKVIYPNESNNRHQERIARLWQETMTWRKVLVDLKPDSHNNINVRRRFTNLFGNVAIADMVETHFGEEACQKYAVL